MTTKTTHTLVLSTTRGRYAFDDSQYGPDVNSGQRLEILLNGKWIQGHVEHSHITRRSTVGQKGLYTAQDAAQPFVGYFFIANDGNACGLCAGMKVR